LKAVLREFEQRSDLSNLGWARMAAYERGSFATLLGISLIDKALSVEAIGDSMALIRDPASSLKRFLPYDHVDEVPSRPVLVSSIPSQNIYYRRATLSAHRWSFDVSPGTTVLAMTDALGLWLLGNADSSGGSALDHIRDQSAFESFVTGAREEKRMKDDDTTLVHLEVVDE
jgi:hypothetical protein